MQNSNLVIKYRYVIIAFIILLVVAITYTMVSKRRNTPSSSGTGAVPTVAAPGYYGKDVLQNPANAEVSQYLQLQTQSDKEFSQLHQNVMTNYPWYNQLPIQGGNYFVYFDLDQKQFIGTIYSGDTEAIKASVLTKLKGMGVDTDQLPIVWN